jgi:hypothetical protein
MEAHENNFEGAASVTYLKDWYEKNNSIINDRLDRAKKSLITLELQLNESIASDESNEESEWQQKFLREKINSCKRAIQLAEMAINLKSIIKDNYSENAIKELTKIYLLHNLSQCKDIEAEFENLWSTILKPMFAREAQFSNDYYVFYTGHRKEAELKYLNIHLDKFSEPHACTESCFKSREFRSKKDLEYSSLKEAFEKHIFTDNFDSDHTSLMQSHFLSTNLTLFGNSTSAESTWLRFWTISNAPSMKDCCQNNYAMNARIEMINKNKRQVLVQIFIKKDLVSTFGYISTPYGYPLYNDLQVILSTTEKSLDSIKKGNYDDIKIEPFSYKLKDYQIKSCLGLSYLHEKANTQSIKAKDVEISVSEFLQKNKIDIKDLQFRLIYLPSLFDEDLKNIIIFDNYDAY